MCKILFVFFALVALTQGATDASIDEFPFLVSVQVLGEHMCTGSIVSDCFVLIPALCVDPYPAISLQVRAGSSSYRSGGTLYQVTDKFIHPNYTTLTGDYAYGLVKTSNTFTITPVQLATVAPREGESFVLSFWGKTQDVLQKEYVITEDWNVCKEKYEPIFEITQRMFCGDSCEFEYGAAIDEDGDQMGFITFRFSCANPNYGQVYTATYSGRDWIEATIDKN